MRLSALCVVLCVYASSHIRRAELYGRGGSFRTGPEWSAFFGDLISNVSGLLRHAYALFGTHKVSR